MANTPFLDLVKPAGTDRALVSVINSNSDKIDGGVSTLSEQIGTKAKFLNLTSSDTAATAYAKLNALSNLDVATIFIDGAVMNNLTGGSITTSANGLVVKGNASTYRYNLMVGASTKTVIFTMSNVSASSWGTIAYFHDLYELETCENLGNFTSQSDLETALNTLVSGMGVNTNKAIQIACTGAFSVFPSGVTYNAMITKGGASNNYASVLFQSISGTAAPIIKATKNQSWRFEQLVTKGDFGRFNMLAKTTNETAGNVTFTVTGRGAGMLFISRNGMESSIYEIHTTDNLGALAFSKIAGSNVTISASSNVLTVSLTNYALASVIYLGTIS